MGRSTILLAGSRRLRGNGLVHSVDPFDCSGDAHSTPHYQRVLNDYGVPSLEDVLRIDLKRFALDNVVEVHKGTSAQIAADWRQPIDLLLLDADQSPQGAKESFESWVRFVKPGGTVVLCNSGERDYAPTHDGNYLLAKERLRPPEFQQYPLCNVCDVRFQSLIICGRVFATSFGPGCKEGICLLPMRLFKVRARGFPFWIDWSRNPRQARH